VKFTRSLIALLALAVFAGVAQADDPQEIVFIFQKQKDPAQIQATADKVAAWLSKEIGKPVKTVVPGDYSASVQALVSKKADFAYVSAMPFLLARRDGNATLLLAEQRTDATGTPRTEYDSIWVVRADSDINSFEDIKAKAGDLRMVFTSPTSTSGYIMAYYRMVKEGMLKPGDDPRGVFKSATFGNGYTQALEQVAAGRADVCTVSDYTMEGPRVDVYLDKEQRDKLKVVARTPGVPTHLIAARDGLSDELKQKVADALLKLSQEQPELLADVYGASAFVKVDENQHVKHAIEAIEYVNLPIEKLAR